MHAARRHPPERARCIFCGEEPILSSCNLISAMSRASECMPECMPRTCPLSVAMFPAVCHISQPDIGSLVLSGAGNSAAHGGSGMAGASTATVVVMGTKQQPLDKKLPGGHQQVGNQSEQWVIRDSIFKDKV